MPFVSIIRLDDHNAGRKDVWRSNKTLSFGNAKSHAVSENNGKEVSDRVSVGRRQRVECRERPYFAIRGVSKIGTQIERLDCDVRAVDINTCDYESCFFLVEEVPGFGREFGKVDNDDVRENSKNTGNYPFNLEPMLAAYLLYKYMGKSLSSLTIKIQLQPSRLARPFNCMRPYARIPAKADAMLPMR